MPSSRAISAALIAVAVSSDSMRMRNGWARARMAARSAVLPDTPKDMFGSMNPVSLTVKQFFGGHSGTEPADEGGGAPSEAGAGPDSAIAADNRSDGAREPELTRYDTTVFATATKGTATTAPMIPAA